MMVRPHCSPKNMLPSFSLQRRLGRHLFCICAIILAAANSGWGQASHLERSLRLLSQGKLDSAYQEAQLALSDPAMQPQAWGVLGTILLQEGKRREAVQDLQKAIALNPRLVGARINLGEAFLAQGQTASAEQAFETALRLAPSNFNARLDLAELQSSLHRYRQSLETTQPIMSQLRQTDDGLVLLATNYLALHQNGKVKHLVQDWTARPASSTEAALRFSALLSRYSMPREAAQVLEKAQSVGEPSYPVAFELANIDLGLGRLSPAERNYQLALRLRPDCALCDMGIARVAEQQKQIEKALAYLIKARQLAPDNPELLFEFGKVCLERNLVDDAFRALQKAVALEPHRDSYVYVLASAYVAKARYAEAAALLDQLLKKHPEDPVLNYAAGAVCYLQTRYPQAQTLLKKSIAHQPHQLAAYYYLGLVYERQMQNTQAIRLFRDLVRRYPEHAPSYVALGTVLLREKEYQQAQEALNKAISMDPDSSDAHYQLGILLGRIGKTAESSRQIAVARKLESEVRKKNEMDLHLLLPD
jgi:tetratricopeptide (TPR) repeat protein